MVSSKSDEKRNMEKLKLDLKPFKAAIVSAYDVLTWQKNYYSVLVFGGISVAYFLLEYLDLSVLTMMSLLAWLVTILDYSVPKISPWLFTDVIGDGEHEEKYEAVCGQMYLIKKGFVEVSQFLFQKRKSGVHVVVVSLLLVGFAWIGAVYDNLMLLYLATLFIAMCAGLRGKDTVKAAINRI